MSKVRGERYLDARFSLQEEYRLQHNRCPHCEPLAVLPTVHEVHRCRRLVTAPPGYDGFCVRQDTLQENLHGRCTNRPWVDGFRKDAKAAGTAVEEYVLKIAQLPHRCSQCEPDALRVPDSITRITNELTRLRRAHGTQYRISFNPL